MKYLLYVVLIILLVPLQAVMYNRLAVFGVHADLVLIAVCLIGLQAGELDAIVVGIALGFTQDLFTGSAHWENLWLKPLLGLMASAASHNVVNLTWSFSKAKRLVTFTALNNIERGDELSHDYRWGTYPWEKMRNGQRR